MGQYVERTLIDGERVLYETHISLWTQWRLVLGGLLLFAGDVLLYELRLGVPAKWYVVPVVLGLTLWLVIYLRYKTTEIAITNRRIVVKHGIIRRLSREVNIVRVQNIDIVQSILGRLFDFGTLDIRCGGLGNPLEEMYDISDPLECHRAVRTVLEVMRGRNAPNTDGMNAAFDTI